MYSMLQYCHTNVARMTNLPNRVIGLVGLAHLLTVGNIYHCPSGCPGVPCVHLPEWVRQSSGRICQEEWGYGHLGPGLRLHYLQHSQLLFFHQPPQFGNSGHNHVWPSGTYTSPSHHCWSTSCPFLPHRSVAVPQVFNVHLLAVD